MEPKDLKAIFEYFDGQYADLKADIQGVKNDVKVLQSSVDNLSKLVKDFHEEMIVTRKRLDLLEEWARKVSEKVGIPLPF